jgi:hypothetical protein
MRPSELVGLGHLSSGHHNPDTPVDRKHQHDDDNEYELDDHDDHDNHDDDHDDQHHHHARRREPPANDCLPLGRHGGVQR